MPLLSDLARAKKIDFFLKPLLKEARILEIGSAGGWVGDFLKSNGWKDYIGLDLFPPADIVGDIRHWVDLGLKERSFDVIIAFEVVEHVDCFKECFDLLKPGGVLLLTSPVPRMDWIMKLLEAAGLNQKRTSPHEHLIRFEEIPFFQQKELKIVGFLSQWGKLTKV